MLTFDWFKKQTVCVEQPWICRRDLEALDESSSRRNLIFDSERSSFKKSDRNSNRLAGNCKTGLLCLNIIYVYLVIFISLFFLF